MVANGPEIIVVRSMTRNPCKGPGMWWVSGPGDACSRASLANDGPASQDTGPGLFDRTTGGSLSDRRSGGVLARLFPGEALERLVHRRLGQVVGVVRHDLLRQPEDHFEHLTLGEARIEKRLQLGLVNMAATT